MILFIICVFFITNIDNFEVLKNNYRNLSTLAHSDKKVKAILNSKEDYPSELLDMLSRNPDMADFVLEYSKKKGKIYSDNIGSVKKGEFPLLLQYDKRWGYGIYGDNVIAVNGCGPTVIAMALAGLTGDNKITPYIVAKYAYENGYYTEYGTSWYLMTEGVKKYGILSENGFMSSF